MKRLTLLIWFSVMLTLLSTPMFAGTACGLTNNLISNCGFETGDFTSWSVGGNTGFTGVTTAAPYPFDGLYGAFLGPVGSDGTLSQTFTGDGSTLYYVQFDLYNPGGTPNDFTVFWNGVDVGPDLVDASPFSYTLFSGFLVGNPGTNTIEFQYRQDPSFWGLDDVGVQGQNPTPEPGTFALLLGGAAFVIVSRLRKKA